MNISIEGRVSRLFEMGAFRPTRYFAPMALLFALVLGYAADAPANERSEAPAPQVLKLAVLIDPIKFGATPEFIVDSLSRETLSPEAKILHERLMRPSNVSLLIHSSMRLPSELRANLKESSPDEILHRYIVLEFTDTETTFAAKVALQRDIGVLFAVESQFATFNAVPGDPLYTSTGAGSNRDYQWALNDPMNFQAAWNVVRGTAYLAHLDNGIQAPVNAPFLHEDLGQPFRRFIFNVNAAVTDVDENPAAAGGYAGHGTHTAGIMAAATSQWPSPPSSYPNPPLVGVSGACWYCSLLVAKISRGLQTIDETVDIPAALYWAINSGAQVVNMSLGGANRFCSVNPSDPYCAALESAAQKAVVIAAAAGNSDFNSGGAGLNYGTTLDFPAVHPHTIAVSAVQSYVSGNPARGNLWTEEFPLLKFFGSSTGPGMDTRGVLAPGRAILSTFYYGETWSDSARCGTGLHFSDPPPPDIYSPPPTPSTYFGPGSTRGPKYGICTGTSMATPVISGLVGLMRTVNPLLDAVQVRSALLSAGLNAASPNITRGYGMPTASTAVNNVLATTNRLTPLFSQYSTVAMNHFYTVVPQMARAAVASGLLPYAVAPTQYLPYGTTISAYANFPDPALIGYVAPRAQVWVFTTHSNPSIPSVELMPLYRLSWKCGDGGSSTCASNPKHVSHFYTASLAEAQTYIGSNFYKFDGIEGYIYPSSQSKPSGTTWLMRAYNTARGDYALFPEQDQANMASQGYTNSVSYLGYVYLNSGPRPTY